MKKLRLKESATQYTTTRNRYGDLVLANVGTISCLFRDISMLSNMNQREQVDIKGLFWFDPAATVAKGDVVGYQGQLYRLEEVTRAKDLLKSDTIQFIKCTATLYRAIS